MCVCVCMRLFLSASFYRKTPQWQRSSAQPWSSSYTDKESTVSPVSNTHHEAASAKNTLLHLITFFKRWLAVTQYTIGLYILQLSLSSCHNRGHINRGPNGWKEDLEIIGGILLESKRMLLLCKLFCLHENTVNEVVPSNYWNELMKVHIISSKRSLCVKQQITWSLMKKIKQWKDSEMNIHTVQHIRTFPKPDTGPRTFFF